MQQEKSLSSEFKESSKALEYMNDFGAIYRDRIIIHSADEIVPIKVKNISKIVFVKRRKLHLNFTFIISSIVFFSVVALNQLYFISQILIEFFSFILAIIGVFYTAYQYKFVVVNKFDFIELLVSNSLKAEAEELVMEFNQRSNKLLK